MGAFATTPKLYAVAPPGFGASNGGQLSPYSHFSVLIGNVYCGLIKVGLGFMTRVAINIASTGFRVTFVLNHSPTLSGFGASNGGQLGPYSHFSVLIGNVYCSLIIVGRSFMTGLAINIASTGFRVTFVLNHGPKLSATE